MLAALARGQHSAYSERCDREASSMQKAERRSRKGGGDGLGSHWSYKDSTLCRSESRLCSQSLSESGALSRLIGTFFSVA